MENFAVKQCNGTFYCQYQKIIQTFDNLSLRLTDKFIVEKLLSSTSLHSKDLVGHFGCVNAIEFSSKGGEYLASGGDDTRILVWKLAEAVKGETTPRCLKSTHLSNIFCVSFDSENKHIISAGNDDQVLVHDFETGELANSLVASDATYDVCIHPENDNIFITAGEHGEVDLYDLRTPDLVEVARGPPAYHSAIYNPVDPALFVTASSVHGIELWDARVPLRCLKRFDSNAGIQCAMGVAFDQTGQYLAAVRRKLPPVLYHIDRKTSLVEFFQEGYYNSCTMKSVCFGGKNDNFIISGSDDFNVYVWEIPMVEKDHEGIMKVEKSSLGLKGHRSIVNQVCFNNTTSMLCTAGVEKIIKMWSPFPLNGGMNEEYSGSQRMPYSRLDYARMIIESGRPLTHDYDDESTSEDPRMIAFFDSLVQKEREGSSTSSVDSSDEDISEQSASNVDILRRIRAIIFEQLRSGRDEDTEETLSDISRTDSPERNSDTNETHNSETLSDGNEGQSEGIGLERLREIIASQQGLTNVRERIASLRRNCLADDDENKPTTSSTLSVLKSNEKTGESTTNGAATDTNQDQISEPKTHESGLEKSPVTEPSVCLENERERTSFETENINEVGECSNESQKKDKSRKRKHVPDLSSAENNFEQIHEYNTRSNEITEVSAEDLGTVVNSNVPETS